MAREAAEAAAGARRQIDVCGERFEQLAHRLRASPPTVIVTCARGSSDHAATYGKYLLETTVGRVVASVGPSIASTYRRIPVLEGALFIAVSQSGRSPDLLALTAAARAGGALVVGMVNDDTSPLAARCDLVLPLCAGEERAVAATKSFLLTGIAFLQLAAAWTNDAELRAAVEASPAALAAAAALDWSSALSGLATASSLYVIGRGVGLGAAYEIALKLKETCRLHAEAFSAAEVLHGPVALVGPGFPVLALAQDDETLVGTRDAIAQLAQLGATVRSTLDGSLPTVPGIPAVLAPLCQVQSFDLAVPQLAAARGLDPDAPPHLRKVTETV
ncbi:MAG: iron dicitrate transport regulator FecR [Myxococcales bacterium]|nr:iron dicitrate transport regulator FecR [Myxococcales bacterium]